MKRAISFILMAATVLTLFVACAETTGDETTVAVATSAVDETTVAVETEDPAYCDNLPDLNYNGTTIRVVSSGRDWNKDEVWVENINGEIINDAVYSRNLHVEERLGVKIENTLIPYTSNDSLENAIKKVVNTSEDVYDVSFINCYRAAMATTSGIFHNLANVENIDLTKSYWLQDFNETMSFHGAQYMATGSIALTTMKFAFATFFNKTLFDNKSVEYPYKAVSDGKWTLDYMLTLLPVFYDDADGSLTPTDADIYSWIANDYIGTDPFWVGCEIPILSKDANGDYVYGVDTAKLSDMVDKLLLMYTNEGTNVFAHSGNDDEQVSMSKAFADGKGAMASFRLLEAESTHMRDMTDKYGVVPMPKYDEAQENYYTHVHDQYSVVTVISTVSAENKPMMGAFLEAMAYQSYKETVPAYYETTLKFKYASDPESWEMLDIVINNIKCEAGNLYYSSIGAPHNGLRTVIQGRSNTVGSTYKGFSKSVPKQVKKLNEALADMIEKE